MIIRKAEETDLDAIASLYEAIHDAQTRTGWVRGIYPVRSTAESGLARGDLFVMEEDGTIVASAVINQIPTPEYSLCRWEQSTPTDRIMVMHTLAVLPEQQRTGLGRKFVEFYEQYARQNGCLSLRMDTQAVNISARAFYRRMGFQERDIIECTFGGIPGVRLVCLEKALN